MKKFLEYILRTDSEELSILLKQSFYILLCAILIGFTVNIFHPSGFILTSRDDEKKKNIVLISSEEARIKKEAAITTFVDSRPSDEYRAYHIPDSINIPADPVSLSVKKIKDNFDLLSQSKELVIYCDGESCGSSEILANTFIDMGYSRHIYIIKHGIPEWESKGLPVNKQQNGSENQIK